MKRQNPHYIQDPLNFKYIKIKAVHKLEGGTNQYQPSKLIHLQPNARYQILKQQKQKQKEGKHTKYCAENNLKLGRHQFLHDPLIQNKVEKNDKNGNIKQGCTEQINKNANQMNEKLISQQNKQILVNMQHISVSKCLSPKNKQIKEKHGQKQKRLNNFLQIRSKNDYEEETNLKTPQKKTQNLKNQPKSNQIFDPKSLKKHTFAQYFLVQRKHENSIFLKVINMNGNPLKTKGIKLLCRLNLPNLQELHMSDSHVSDAGIAYLTKNNWRSLKTLQIGSNDYNITGFQLIAQLQFRGLKSICTLNQSRSNYIGVMQMLSSNWERLEDFSYYTGMQNFHLRDLLMDIKCLRFRRSKQVRLARFYTNLDDF